jgi:hypothetical protein
MQCVGIGKLNIINIQGKNSQHFIPNNLLNRELSVTFPHFACKKTNLCKYISTLLGRLNINMFLVNCIIFFFSKP